MEESSIFSAPKGQRDYNKETEEAKELLINTFKSLATEIGTQVSLVLDKNEINGLGINSLPRGHIMNHQDQIGSIYVGIDSNRELEQIIVLVNVERIVENYKQVFYDTINSDLGITVGRNEAVVHAALIQIGKIIKLKELLRLDELDVIQSQFNLGYQQDNPEDIDLSSDVFYLAGELYAATKIFKYMNNNI